MTVTNEQLEAYRAELEAERNQYALNPSTATVGMGVTVLGWSDADPYEIVKISPSGKTLTIREMKATRNPEWKMEWVQGGFAGHLKNQDEQEWIIESDPDGFEIRANWSNKFNRFQSKLGKLGKDHGARKHYDFNF